MEFGALCFVVVVAIIAYFVWQSMERGDKRYRYHCGECRHITDWMTESQAEDAHIEHYLLRHPGIPSGGQVETRH